MKQRSLWSFALLSILTLMMVPCFATAASSIGNLEVGGVITDVEDNTARANEYVKNRTDDGGSMAIKAEVESIDGNSAFDLNVDLTNGDIFKLETGIDINRIFKFDMALDSFQHWKDKETLGQLGATMQGDLGGDQPRVSTNLTGSYGADYADLAAANAQYYEEQSNDYLITRKEWSNEAELHLPQLPNIIFHAGLRIEERDGMEQSITLSKCSSCHIEAEGKDINERTEDFTFGVTGKFGIVTVEYEYLNRKFKDQSTTEMYNYLTNAKVRSDIIDHQQLLYAGDLEHASTPDSEKDSHLIKARVDLPYNTIFTGSYVKADIESQKADLEDDLNDAGTATYEFIGSDNLKSEYTGYTGKLATRVGPLRLSATANVYEIDGPEYTLFFEDRGNIDVDPYETTQTYHSAESREVTEAGLDIVYRIAMGTTIRLGYDYEDIERDEHELGETETHTFKAAINSRLSKQLSVRGSYEYQDIDNPLSWVTGIGQVSGDDVGGGAMLLTTADYVNIDNNTNTVYYWNNVYGSRELDATNLPDEVQELKTSVSWSPAANMAATISARVRIEENSAVHYEQRTYVPGASFWYAPNSNLNLTMAYSFNKQETENQMCVGWYHG